jgi:hypothetical protein
MNEYTVTMESGNDYFVSAESPESAMAEAERLARVVHGVIDTAISAN